MEKALRGSMSPNFVPQILGGCVVEQAGATQGINDLLMQSYNGVIELFASEQGWGDVAKSARAGEPIASFAALRARGAFLVSATLVASSNHPGWEARGVVVVSEAGAACTLAAIWPGKMLGVTDRATGALVPVALVRTHPTLGPIYQFHTRTGHTYDVAPSTLQ